MALSPAYPLYTPQVTTEETPLPYKWIDGKELYAKIIEIAALPAASATVTTAHGITDIDTVVVLHGVAVRTSTGLNITLPHYGDNALSETLALTFQPSDGGDIQTVSGGTDYSGYTGFVYVEYTKT